MMKFKAVNPRDEVVWDTIISGGRFEVIQLDEELIGLGCRSFRRHGKLIYLGFLLTWMKGRDHESMGSWEDKIKMPLGKI